MTTRTAAIALAVLALAASSRPCNAADEDTGVEVVTEDGGATQVGQEAETKPPTPADVNEGIARKVRAMHGAFDVGMILEVLLWSANAGTGFYPPAAAGGFGLAITAPLFLGPSAKHMALMRDLGVEPSARARALLGTAFAFAIFSVTAAVPATVLGAGRWQHRIDTCGGWTDPEGEADCSAWVNTTVGNASIGVTYGVVVPLGFMSMILGWVAYYVTRNELMKAAAMHTAGGVEAIAGAEAGASIASTIMPTIAVGKDGMSIGMTMNF